MIATETSRYKFRVSAVAFVITMAGLAACLGCGTRPGKFQSKLIAAIQRCPAQTSCMIRLRDLTDFSWDHMYFFTYTADRRRVEETLGAKVPRYQDGPKIVFMNKGKIVHYEDEPGELEKMVPNEVRFDNFPDNKYYRVYGPDASFAVKTVDLSPGTGYDLDSVGGYQHATNN